MTPEKLDLIFPFVVFVYGAAMTLVLHHPFFVELAEQRLPGNILNQIRSHRVLAMVCLAVGSIWSTQNLWL